MLSVGRMSLSRRMGTRVQQRASASSTLRGMALDTAGFYLQLALTTIDTEFPEDMRGFASKHTSNLPLLAIEFGRF